MGDNNLIIAVFTCLALFLTKAFALQGVKFLLTNWTRLYTWVAPESERNDHREQVESDFHDQVRSILHDGYHPAEAAVHIFLRMASAMPSDIAWSLSHLPGMVASKLERGSQRIRTLRTPRLVIVSVGILALMNTAAWTSDTDPLWREILLVNIGTGCAIALTRYQERTWAKRLMMWATWVMITLLLGFLTWITIEHRLYETPKFAQSVLHMSVGISPVILAIIVGSNACRSRVFKGHWWPVLVAWFLIASISLISAIMLDSEILLVVWASTAIGLFGLTIISVVFCGGAALAYLGATKGTATCMTWAAYCIRQVTNDSRR